MKTQILAIAILAATASLGLVTAAQAQSTSFERCYRNSAGLRQCDVETATPNTINVTRCVFVGANHKCESDATVHKAEPPVQDPLSTRIMDGHGPR